MKKLILLGGFLILMTAFGYSQTDPGEITIVKKRYNQNGQALKPNQLKTILTANPASAPEYMEGQKKMSIAAPMIIGGSVCVIAGSALSLAGTIKESNDINNGTYSGEYSSGLGLILLGLVVDVAALPFIIPANKHFKRSVELYNESLKKTGYRTIQFNMMVSSTGLGIRMNF